MPLHPAFSTAATEALRSPLRKTLPCTRRTSFCPGPNKETPLPAKTPENPDSLATTLFDATLKDDPHVTPPRE